MRRTPARFPAKHIGSERGFDSAVRFQTEALPDFPAWLELVLRRAKRGVSDEDEAAN
jgi:hypothetical protein